MSERKDITGRDAYIMAQADDVFFYNFDLIELVGDNSRHKQGSPSGCLPSRASLMFVPRDRASESRDKDNDCTNYTQIDPTHRHGHIDGRLGRRLASDVSTRRERISPRYSIYPSGGTLNAS